MLWGQRHANFSPRRAVAVGCVAGCLSGRPQAGRAPDRMKCRNKGLQLKKFNAASVAAITTLTATAGASIITSKGNKQKGVNR